MTQNENSILNNPVDEKLPQVTNNEQNHKGSFWGMTSEQKFLFRYMFLTLGYYATPYKYDKNDIVFHPITGEADSGILHDAGAQAREALKLVREHNLDPIENAKVGKAQVYTTELELKLSNEVKALKQEILQLKNRSRVQLSCLKHFCALNQELVRCDQLTVNNLYSLSRNSWTTVKGTLLPIEERVLCWWNKKLDMELQADIGDYIVTSDDVNFFVIKKDVFESLLIMV